MVPPWVALLMPQVVTLALLVSILRDPRRRGWHDKAAGTIAIHSE
jgi:uncharacterized RDD family membrane protein YckC